MVGYFIGDSPHIVSVHATVNRIWSSPQAGSKIDVQFTEKNTVLFRIDNNQMRTRVLQRKYWHIADVPLVVNFWSPELALNPPDLTSMPLWVDLRGVPNDLYSHKGLKCVTKAVGKFVKLHPNTERCIRLDVARVLAEVNLHESLVEKITFKDKEGIEREIAMSFPWLPPRCTVCRRWGHKGQDCSGKDIILLKKVVGGENTKSVGVPSDIVKESWNEERVISDLIQDLEAITPIPARAEDAEHTTRQESSGDHRLQAREESHGIQLIEPTTESFHASDSGKLESGHGGKKGADLRGSLSMKRAQTTHTEYEERIAISPSRFSPLQDIEEEGEEEMETMTKEVEEGEICEGTQNQRHQYQMERSLVWLGSRYEVKL